MGCFGAQQAAEKAVKGAILHLNMEGWGHSVTDLLVGLRDESSVNVPEALIDRAKQLDKHYIPTRYPNGFERGKPADYYTDSEAEEAIRHARKILTFCHRQTGSEEEGPPGA